MSKRIIVRAVGILLTIITALFIFFMSAQPAKQSSDLSGGFIRIAAEILIPNFDDLDVTVQTEIIEKYQTFVRKAAHFTIYLLLCVFASITALTFNKLKWWTRYILALLFTLLYAISDEIHQIFVPGRAGMITDVLIDFSGALLGVLLLMAAIKIFKLKRIYK